MTIAGGLHSGALWGEEHTRLGDIAVLEIQPHLAIALSRGKFPKGYPHLDPNEDAVFAASDGVASLLAVVDGHSGFDAARAALGAVSGMAPSVLASSREPHDALSGVFEAARRAVGAAVTGLDEERAGSRTALAVALIARDRLTVGVLGDCAVVLIRGTKVRRVGSFAPFLSPDTSVVEVARGETTMSPGDRVLVASDGLFDFLGRRWGKRLATLAGGADPATLVQEAVEAAFAGGAGDNIAIAVADGAPGAGGQSAISAHPGH